MSQSLSREFSEALQRECTEPTQDALDIMLIMIKDKETLDMIGVYYTMGKSFQMRGKSVCNAQQVELEEFANLIKNRDLKYARSTVSIVTAMWGTAASPLYGARYPSSCQGKKWMDVQNNFRKRGFKRNEQSADENEALYIHNTIMKQADELRKGQAQSSLT